MTRELIMALEAIVYAQIEAAGLTASNLECQNQGKAIPYNESDFIRVAEQMRGRVREVIG